MPQGIESSWCIKKGYKIYPVIFSYKWDRYAKNKIGTEFNIVIEYGDKIKKGEKVYSKNEWSDAIWGIYKYLYNKYNEGKD